MKSQIEIFICNHKRDNKEDCFHKGGKVLTDQIKKWSKEQSGPAVKVYRSGCLGKCEEGIAIATYPKKEFLLNVEAKDGEEIKEYIKHQVV